MSSTWTALDSRCRLRVPVPELMQAMDRQFQEPLPESVRTAVREYACDLYREWLRETNRFQLIESCSHDDVEEERCSRSRREAMYRTLGDWAGSRFSCDGELTGNWMPTGEGRLWENHNALITEFADDRLTEHFARPIAGVEQDYIEVCWWDDYRRHDLIDELRADWENIACDTLFGRAGCATRAGRGCGRGSAASAETDSRA